MRYAFVNIFFPSRFLRGWSMIFFLFFLPVGWEGTWVRCTGGKERGDRWGMGKGWKGEEGVSRCRLLSPFFLINSQWENRLQAAVLNCLLVSIGENPNFFCTFLSVCINIYVWDEISVCQYIYIYMRKSTPSV